MFVVHNLDNHVISNEAISSVHYFKELVCDERINKDIATRPD